MSKIMTSLVSSKKNGASVIPGFITSTLLCFVLYLGLTTGTGDVGIWSGTELIIGLILSLVAAAIATHVMPDGWHRMLDPRRWLILFFYLVGPFFWAMTKANVDVVYRVITGRINPGILRISPGLRNDASITFLANSITLTPGTLTVDIDEQTNDLFVHWINVAESTVEPMQRRCKVVCGEFPAWARRIAG